MRRCVKPKKVFIVRIVYFIKSELAVNMSLFPAPRDRTIPTPDWQFRSKKMEVWPGSLGVLLDLQNVMYLHWWSFAGKAEEMQRV